MGFNKSIAWDKFLDAKSSQNSKRPNLVISSFEKGQILKLNKGQMAGSF